MDNKQYEKTIAKLQTKADFLEAELFYLNQLLVQIGFDEGIITLKQAALEVLSLSEDETEASIFKKRPENF